MSFEPYEFSDAANDKVRLESQFPPYTASTLIRIAKLFCVNPNVDRIYFCGIRTLYLYQIVFSELGGHDNSVSHRGCPAVHGNVPGLLHHRQLVSIVTA